MKQHNIQGYPNKIGPFVTLEAWGKNIPWWQKCPVCHQECKCSHFLFQIYRRHPSYQPPRLRYKSGLREIRSDQFALLRIIGGWRCPKYPKDSPGQGDFAGKRLAGANFDFCSTRTGYSEAVHWYWSSMMKLGTPVERRCGSICKNLAFLTLFIAVELCLCWKDSLL